MTRILRNGVTCEIHRDELMVGDILLLETGNEVPADCLVI